MEPSRQALPQSGTITDSFKEVFKYFKRKQPPPDLSSAIDFDLETSFHQQGIKLLNITDLSQRNIRPDDASELAKWGLRPPRDWKVFAVECRPGFLFIRNPFTQCGTEYWVEQCFDKYWRHPNPTNLRRDVDEGCKESDILKNLRWATLGYHHNWDTKEYSEDNKGAFPSDLSQLSESVARCVGFENFRPEAAIVNYYASDSSLGGHTDHSEKNNSAPLFSFSFGQSAIFLLGGRDKSVKPTAIHVRSGDIIIMSGPSRLCYHAVPRILQSEDVTSEPKDVKWWWPLITKMRLNINIRQVNF